MSGEAESAYGPRRAAYDLKKLRGKGMVCKIGASRRYESVKAGLQAMTALVVLREKVIKPLLAASQRPEPQTTLNHPTPVDHHYEHLRAGMRDLFTALGGRRIRIDNLFLIFSYKLLGEKSWASIRSHV